MKLISREALVLGGVFSVLETPFYFFDNPIVEQLGFIIGILFFVSLLLLFVPKFFTFVHDFMQKYPMFSYYLVAIGWVIYLIFVGLFLIPLLTAVFKWSDETLDVISEIFSFICNWGILISLIMAFIIDRSGVNKSITLG